MSSTADLIPLAGRKARWLADSISLTIALDGVIPRQSPLAPQARRQNCCAWCLPYKARRPLGAVGIEFYTFVKMLKRDFWLFVWEKVLV